MIKQSFTLRVLVVTFLLLALPLLVDSFLFFQDSYEEAIQDAKLDLKEAATFRTFSLAEIQPIRQVLLKELIFLLNKGEKIEDIDGEAMSVELEKIAHLAGTFQVFILELGEQPEYKILASSIQEYIGKKFTSYTMLPKILEKGEGNFVQYLYINDEERYVPIVFVARVIPSDVTGERVGIMLVTARIDQELATLLAKVDHIQFAVVTADGIIFAASDRALEGSYFGDLSMTRRNEILSLKEMGNLKLPDHPLPLIEGRDPPYFEFIFDNRIQIAYQAHIPDSEITVIAYASKEMFFGKAIRHFLFIYSLYGFLLIGGALFAYWLSQWISRPLRQLSGLMGQVSEGNLDVYFEKEPLGFEINILGEIFNNTLKTLLSNIQRAEDERVKKETYARELAIGRDVQQKLLPAHDPVMKGAQLASLYLPAEEVGGDFYSYLLKDEGKVLHIAVADSCGKGISSCLYALSARSLYRTYATRYDDPAEVVCRTNDAFLADAGESGNFVTLFSAVYLPESKELKYYSAGHVAPIVKRANGAIEHLRGEGMALGLKESVGYQTESIQLESGDLVLFYTKGVAQASLLQIERLAQVKKMCHTKGDDEGTVVALKIQ